MVSKYPKRISGPILDRIDIHLDVPRVAGCEQIQVAHLAEALQYRRQSMFV